MADWLLQIPCFGLLLTLGAFMVGTWIYQKTKLTVLQPILTGCILIIIFIKATDMDLAAYDQQNQILNYMLPLTAVVLAVPLYRNMDVLKKYWVPILCGVVAGTAATMGTIVALGKLMGTQDSIIISMLPKSATNPIAIEVSRVIGGEPSLTVALVVVVGLFGAVVGPELLKLFGVKHPVAKGIAIGAMSHAVGTSRAFKEGEIEGSMSSLAMALAGVMTAFLAPVFAAIVG